MRHLDPGMGLNLGGLRFFPVIKIIVDRQVRKIIACTEGLAWKQSHAKSRTAREDRKRIFCFAFSFTCVVRKNPKTPKMSPMADDAITRGGKGSLVSPLYICG